MKSGIYRITNIVNGKFYIGSSYNIRLRFNGHLNDLRNNRHCNNHLQRSFNKYGEDRFVFETLVYCSIEELLILEQYLMDFYQPEYNICKIAGSPLGIKRSEETKKAQSERMRGKKLSNVDIENVRQGLIKYYQENTISVETREKLRKASTKRGNSKKKGGRPNTWQTKLIQQIDIKTGEIINTYNSVAHAAKVMGWGESSIAKCARGEQLTAGGFIWRYV